MISVHGSFSDRLQGHLVTKTLVKTFDTLAPAILKQLRDAAPVDENTAGDPRKTAGGRLRDSIKYGHRYTAIGSVEMRYTTDLYYAPYVIHGAQIPDIYPQAARALLFYSHGNPIFTKHVAAHNIPANDFPKKAAEKIAPMVSLRLREAMSEVLR